MDIVCLRNMSVNTLHKGDDDDNNNNNDRTCNLTGDQTLASQLGTSSSKPGDSIVRFVVDEVACQHVLFRVSSVFPC